VSAYDDALTVLRAWAGELVEVCLEPEGTVMHGRLEEREGAGAGEALFALAGEGLTGVAVALFRDGVRTAARDGDALVVEQGRVTLTVTRRR
jgi:hypothetical protein